MDGQDFNFDDYLPEGYATRPSAFLLVLLIVSRALHGIIISLF